jgi:predicted small integral membrane protein
MAPFVDSGRRPLERFALNVLGAAYVLAWLGLIGASSLLRGKA